MATRRDVLKKGMATGIAAVLAGGALDAVVAPPVAADTTAGGPFSRSTFLGLLDERFGARGSTASAILTLTAVRDLPQADRLGLVDNEECFLLRFKGPERTPLEQGTYKLWHLALDAFPLFLVPMGRGRGGRVYEAVINRPQPD